MTLHISPFEGGNALSSFRIQQLLPALQGIHDKITGIAGRYIHLVASESVLDSATSNQLSALLTYGDLLDIFMETHDPTQLNRQGNDVGTQYRSAIFPVDAAQEAAARAGINRAQVEWPHPIVTTIEPMATWYPAEDYHQDYWVGEGQRNPYCLAVIPPKLAKLKKGWSERLK